jgi:glycosyltransferase involved in cell wall biosynthesis
VPATASLSAVIRAEADGYDLGKERLMGRQAAGHGFLRAAVGARGQRAIQGMTASAQSAKAFADLVRSIDPAAPFQWLRPHQLAEVSAVGTLYLPAPTLGPEVRLRQRAGIASYSVCGVTHTTASRQAMDALASLLTEPVMPWDALVCTSTAVLATVHHVLEAQAHYLRWRFGSAARLPVPQLPVIPLGVYCDDFVVSDAQRTEARRALGLADDEVVGLFLGRLVFHAKAHPYAMLRAFQRAAEQTGKCLALIFCGWFPNAAIEAAFRSGAEAFAPAIKAIFVEGREPAARTHSWAASDLFVSLSDNIQETFGLTPIEAMAAGLPVVVSDWDGYRDTVRHEVEGFCVPTIAPQPGMGNALAQAHENGMLNYDRYCWAAAAATAVDVGRAGEAIAALAGNAALRRRMGEAGRQRARALYDWPVVYCQYQALWADLQDRRRSAADDDAARRWIDAAPRASAASLDPFAAFGHYPTITLGPGSRIGLAPDAEADLATTLGQALGHALFDGLAVPRHAIEAMLDRLQTAERTVAELAESLGIHVAIAACCAGLLIKLGLARVASDSVVAPGEPALDEPRRVS